MSSVEREKLFVCVDCDLPDHPRVQRLRDPAGSLGLWLAMLCYSREHLTDGLVPKRVAITLWGDKKNDARLADMVTGGLLEETATDYLILRYEPRNQTKAMVEESKRKSREKMRNWRKAQAEKSSATAQSVTGNDDSNDTGHESGNERGTSPPRARTRASLSISLPVISERETGGTDPEPVEPTVTQPVSRAASMDRLGAFGMEGTWWSEGVAKATGGNPLPVQRFDLRDLSQALAVQFAGLGQVELERAVRESAEEYGGTLRDKQGASVRSYVAWLRTQPRRAPAGPLKPIRQAPLPEPPMSPEATAAAAQAGLEMLQRGDTGPRPK